MTRGKWLGATILCASAIAFAAPANASVPGFNWTGFYLGANAGASFDDNNLSFRDDSVAQDLTFSDSNSDSSFLGGGQLGYNWMWGNTIVGLEGDASFGSDVDWIGSIRARLGWGSNVLFYVTGGFAWASEDQDFTVHSTANGNTHFSRGSNDNSGYTLGAGLEFPIGSNLTLGAEGLYYDLGGDTAHLVAAGGEPFTVRDDSTFWVARARLTWYVNN